MYLKLMHPVSGGAAQHTDRHRQQQCQQLLALHLQLPWHGRMQVTSTAEQRTTQLTATLSLYLIHRLGKAGHVCDLCNTHTHTPVWTRAMNYVSAARRTDVDNKYSFVNRTIRSWHQLPAD